MPCALVSLVSLVTLVTLAPRALADGAPASASAPRHGPRRVKAVDAADPGNAILHVTPGALGTPWTFEITNYDDTPLRVVADSRLLSLDLSAGDEEDATTPAHRKKAVVHCALPAEVRPVTDSERVRTLPPRITYVEEFDPRMYCFDGREAAALTPSARLVAHLGWPSSHSHAPPFVVDETLTGHQRSGVAELTAEAVMVPDTISDDPPATHPQAIVVRSPSHVDAEVGRDLAIEVSAENTTTRPVRLMLRPETLAFDVLSPKGVHHCSGKTHPAAPIAEVFSTIPPHGKLSTSVLLATICPDAAFQAAGLYTVQARIDTRHASGRSIGLETFDGVARASEPTLVRVRRDRARRP